MAGKRVVVLKIWGDLTFDEIGEQLSISPNTAASRWRYAMEALRKLISARTYV
ncbi:MAG: sigma factor-like helix-turn-helix DNA-binding protein [Opitutae bacterium]